MLEPAERQVVARLDVGAGTGLDGRALSDALRCHDVALLAICEVQKGDVGGAVGVVLDVSDLGRHAVLVVATEIDQTVRALVTATLVPGGDTTVCVTSTATVQGANQRLLGRAASDFREIGNTGAATARSGRLVLTDCHESSRPLYPKSPSRYATGPPKISMGLLSAESVTSARLVSLRLP